MGFALLCRSPPRGRHCMHKRARMQRRNAVCRIRWASRNDTIVPVDAQVDLKIKAWTAWSKPREIESYSKWTGKSATSSLAGDTSSARAHASVEQQAKRELGRGQQVARVGGLKLRLDSITPWRSAASPKGSSVSNALLGMPQFVPGSVLTRSNLAGAVLGACACDQQCSRREVQR